MRELCTTQVTYAREPWAEDPPSQPDDALAWGKGSEVSKGARNISAAIRHKLSCPCMSVCRTSGETTEENASSTGKQTYVAIKIKTKCTLQGKKDR